MKRQIGDTYRSVYKKLDPESKKHTFEMYGYDFMLDDEFKLYLIECNTNPCLAVPCPLLARIISDAVDSTFRVTIDPVFQPTQPLSVRKKKMNSNDALKELKMDLIYDSEVDAEYLDGILRDDQGAKINGKWSPH